MIDGDCQVSIDGTKNPLGRVPFQCLRRDFLFKPLPEILSGRMATIGSTDAAQRAGEAGKDGDEYCNRADDVRERLHIAERDAHVFAVEANEELRRDSTRLGI